MGKHLKFASIFGAAALIVFVALSALAAPPESLNITSPLGADPLARRPGASITLSFDYTSNPSVPPATTRALGRVGLVGADPSNPDLDTVIAQEWKDIDNGSGLSESINLTIPASQAEGSYDARVVLTNSDGSPMTDWEMGAVIIDNTAPNAPTSLTIPDDVNPGPDGYINVATPTLNWGAATDNGNPPSGIAKYWVQIDGGFAWREVTAPTTTYTVPSADALADGTYTARVKAEDKAGNVGPEVTISFTVDTAVPVAPAFVAEPAYTKGTSNTITWDAVTDPVTATCEYYAEYSNSSATDASTGNFTTPLGSSNWITAATWTVNGLESGTQYYYHVKARDLAGNVSAWSTVQFSTQDDAAPVFDTSTYTPAAGSWNNVPSLTVSVEVTDAIAGINTSAFVFTVDGNPPDIGTPSYAGDVLSGTFSGLTTGTHTVYVKAYDNADPDGNWAETTWTFGVDLQGPEISNTQPYGWITNSSPTVSADYSTGPSGLDISVNSVSVRRSDYIDPGTSDTKKDGTWTASGGPDYLSGTLSYAPGAISDGQWSVSLDAKDRAGNTRSADWVFRVDTTPPGAPGLPSTTTPTNNTTPAWTWAASAGDPAAPDGTAGSGLDHYEVKIGTTAGGDDILATTNVGNVTTWTTDLDPSTPGNQGFADDGTYYISVRAVDVVGNPSAWVVDATTKVVIDTVAPSLSGNAPIGYISTASPTLTVTFDDAVGATTVSGYGSTTTFTLDGGSVLPVTGEPASGAATGTITKATSGLAEGSHTVSITVQDKAGNSTTLGTVEAPWTFFVDTQLPTPPTVTVTSPTNDTTPTFTFKDASDPASSSGLASYTIEIWSGGVKVRGPYTAAYAADPFSWTVPDADALTPDDSYEIRVWATDAADNVSASYGSATVVIDTARPVLANGSPTGYVATTTNTISADFTDEGVGLDASETQVTFTNAGNSYGPYIGVFSGTDGSLSTTVQRDFTDFWDGQWTVDMVAYDLAGNKTTPDPTLQWTFKIDTTPPTNPGSPVAGNAHESNGKWYINTLRPTFSWAASNDPAAPDGTLGSGLKDYTFQFGESATKPASTVDTWAGALVDQSGITPTPGVSTQQWTPSTDLPLAAGVEYAGRVKAFDNLSNASEWADPVVIYDPDPPTVPGTPSTTSPTNDGTPVWTWTGSTDDISGVDTYHIQIRRQGSTDWDVLNTLLDIPDSTAPTDPQNWEQGLQLQDGTYEIRVRAMDVAGNYSDWSGIGTVTVDTTPPAVPGMPQTVSPTNDVTPTWTWGAVTGAASYKVYLDDVLMSDDSDVTDTQYTPTAALGEGRHYLQVSSVDALGNESALSEAGYVVIDTTGPVAPVVTLVTPSPTNETPQIWTWSRPADVVRYDFGESADGTTPPATFTNVGNVDTYDTNFTTDGTHYVMVRAYDALGNAGDWSAAASVVIDRTPPGVPTNLAVPSPTNDTTPTWTWTASTGDISSYEVSLDGAAPVNVGNVTQYTAPKLHDGTHSLAVRALDALGNAGDWAVPVEVVVDTTPPAVPAAPVTTPNPTKEANQVWTWDAVSDPDLDYYEVLIDGVTLETPVNVATYTTSLSEGEHFLQVRTVDEVGNKSLWSEKGYVTVDRTKPADPAMLPLEEYTNADEVIFTWSQVTDAVKYDFSYSLDGGNNWSTIEDLTVQTHTVDISGASDGDVIQGKAVAYDAAGNASAESNVASTTVDRMGPELVAVSPLEPVVTPNPRPTWEWNSSDAVSGVAVYVITLDGEAAGLTTTMSFTPSSDLADGEHMLRVVGVDNAGNETLLEFPTVTIDATAPDAPVMAAEPEFTQGLANTVSWGAVSGAARYHVQCSSDSTFNTVDFEGNTVTGTSKEFSGLQDGVIYYYRVRGIDEVGNVGFWSNIVNSTQDASPPFPIGSIPTITPLVTKGDVLTFQWQTAVDDVSGIGAYRLELSYLAPDGTEDTGDEVLPGEVTTYTASDAPEGRWMVRARGIDKVDNEGDDEYWSPWSLPAIVDRTAPAVPTMVTEPTYTPGTSNTVSWGAVDDVGVLEAVSGLAGYDVQMSTDSGFPAGSPIQSIEADMTSATFTGLAPGQTYYYRVRAKDAAGNMSAWSAATSSTQDPSPLAAPVMAEEPAFTVGTSNTVSWSEVSGANEYHVQCSTDSTFATVTAQDEHVAGTSKTFGSLSDGATYYYRVRAVDTDASAPVYSDWSNIVHSTQDASEPSAPGTPSTPSPTTNRRPTWTWAAATDAGIGVADYWVELSVGGAVPVMVPRQGGGSVVYEGWVGNVTSWTYEDDLADGTYALRVMATDAFDQDGAWSEPGYVTIDTTAPGVPTNLAVTSPTADNTPTWTWTASTGDVASYEVSLDGAAAVNIGNEISYTPPALTDGMHNLKVRALDALGNASAWAGPAEVLVDTVAPVITLINPVNGARLNITTASTFLADLFDSGSGIDQTKVRLRIDGGEWVEPTAIVGGTLYYVVSLPFVAADDKWHSLEIEARDVVGNKATVHACFKVELYREGFGFGRLRFPED